MGLELSVAGAWSQKGMTPKHEPPVCKKRLLTQIPSSRLVAAARGEWPRVGAGNCSQSSEIPANYKHGHSV